MALSRQAVTYAIVALMVMWVLLGAITLPNANNWFKKPSYAIHEDVISFNSSSNTNKTYTMDDAIVAKDENSRLFITNVYAIDNTPPVPNNGLQGVLYDLGDACGNDPKAIPVPTFVQQHNISKIALIRQSVNCFLADKLKFAQQNGATGAIVYHNISADDDPSANYSGMGVMSKSIEIPTYYVDLKTGLTLLADLESILKSNSIHAEQGYVDLNIRVVLSPGSNQSLDHWQFALIIVGIMLITSILVISALQCHMWHMAQFRAMNDTGNEVLTADEQRQLNIDENYWRGIIGHPPQPLIIQMQNRKHRLDQAIVDLLPTRVYKENGSIHVEKKENTKESSVTNVSVDSFGTTCELSSCVICLEPFASGEILRRLPCSHEYHKDCIDVWLTKKNNTCPLCQRCIEIPTVPSEAQIREDDERLYSSMPDLAETWTGLARDEQIAMRQSPWATSNNPVSYNQTNTESRRSHQDENINPYPPL